MTLGLAAPFACSVDDRPLKGLNVVILSGGESGVGAGDSGAAAGDAGEAATGSGGTNTGGGAGVGGANVGGANVGGANGGGAGGTSAGAQSTGNGGVGGTEAGTSGDGGTAGTPTGGTGGDSGSSGSAGTGVVGRCPDLDENQVLDCDESIAENPSFDENVHGWRTDPDLALDWSDTDALEQSHSGSLAMTNELEVDQDGSKLAGAHQCLPVAGGSVYRFATEVSVPEEAGETRAGLQLVLYDSSNCAGMVVDNITSSLFKGEDWNVIELTYQTPTGAKSVAVRLISVKLFRQPAATVSFDNVLVRPE